MTRRTKTFIAMMALTGGGLSFAGQAGAQQAPPAVDQIVDLCRPQLAQMTQLDPHQATFTIPAGCPAGVQVRYSANLVVHPCGTTPAGEHVCTLPDDWTVPWHDGLLDQVVVSAGVHDATPGAHLMPLVDPCENTGGILQLDLGVIPPGGGPADEINVTHRYYQCAPLTAAQTRDLPPTVDSPSSTSTTDVPPAPPAGAGTGGQTPDDTSAVSTPGLAATSVEASSVVIDAPGPDRAALPMTGGQNVGLLSIVGAGLLACGGALLARGRRMAGRSGR